jgi:hypothetical protein
VRRHHPLADDAQQVLDTALGLLLAGARAGRTVSAIGIVPARAAYRSPLGAPWRALADGLAADGIAVRRELEARAQSAFDRALAGPLTEQLGRLLGEHRIVERLAQELIAQGTVTAVVDEALNTGLAAELTDRVLRSPEMQQLIHHIASSPDLRAAMAEQSAGLADEMVAGVRSRAQSMDDLAERTVRGWLRRPRPKPA